MSLEICLLNKYSFIEKENQDSRSQTKEVALLRRSFNEQINIAHQVRPTRFYQWYTVLNDSLQRDISYLTLEQQTLFYNVINCFMEIHSSRSTSTQNRLVIPKERRTECWIKSMAYFARSNSYYRPVVIKWVDYILKKACATNKKIIFLARDGSAPYQLALKMIKTPYYQKHAKFLQKPNQIALAYFSRKIITLSNENSSHRDLFTRYVTQELRLKRGDDCLFVDIGFSGSMISTIKEMLPGISINFEFLVSLTPQAMGFATDPMPMRSIPAAGGNKGVHWLEDSHQGVLKSPSHLVETDGRVFPSTLVPGKIETFIDDPIEFLLRSSSQVAITREAWDLHNPNWIDKEVVVDRLDGLLDSIKRKETPLYLQHV